MFSKKEKKEEDLIVYVRVSFDNEDMLNKFKEICKIEKRTMKSHISYLVRHCILDFK